MEGKYKAVVLVGGLGERLRPITESVPKPMVEIEGKPFLEYKIESLRKYGVKNFILCVGHLGHIVKDYLGDGKRFGINIEYSYDELLGTGGAIKNAEDLLSDDFIVCNGDTFLDIEFNKLIRFHEGHGCPCTLVVADATHPKTQELVDMRGTDIRSVYQRGTAEHENHLRNTHKPLSNAGAYIMKKEILDLIPKNKKVSLEQEILPKLMGKIKVFVHNGYILDIADKEDWDELRKDVNAGLILPTICN